MFFFGASLDFPWTVQRAVSLLPTLIRLISWRTGETCQSLIRSLHLRDLAAPHLQQSVSLLGCCLEVRLVGLRQDELIVTVGTELIMQSLGASCVRGVFFPPTASLREIKILIFKVGNPNHRELKSLTWLGASVYLPSATTPSDCGRKARDYQRHTVLSEGGTSTAVVLNPECTKQSLGEHSGRADSVLYLQRNLNIPPGIWIFNKPRKFWGRCPLWGLLFYRY